jgi:hypothetical protein
MKNAQILTIVLLLLASGVPAAAQHHQGNWLYRTATDTTVVRCWTDSLSWMAFAPNSMNMMMMPDSMYMRIDRMVMDSLHIPHDSTFIGWCRVQAGRDSMHFDMMNGDSMYGSRNTMQFMRNLICQIHWDSLMSDSAHRHWHPTGMKGWNGSAWVNLTGVMKGTTISLATSQIYTSFAFVGTASAVASVAYQQMNPGEFRLEQNYPNPFNPSTKIGYELPSQVRVTLTIYNVLGQQVAELVNGEQAPGRYEVQLNAQTFASGIYMYQLQAGTFVQTRKLLLIK